MKHHHNKLLSRAERVALRNITTSEQSSPIQENKSLEVDNENYIVITTKKTNDLINCHKSPQKCKHSQVILDVNLLDRLNLKLSPENIVPANALYLHTAQILDIRPSNEFQKGHIPHAINIKSTDLAFNLQNNDDYIIYCENGSQSIRSFLALKLLGFKNIKFLSGGYIEWMLSG